ncbi:MAG: hypothetical protein RSA08_04310, partial [Clostridia bacterium]
MKKCKKFIFLFILVSAFYLGKESCNAVMSPTEAGQYMSEFAINFYENHGKEVIYDWSDNRWYAVNGIKTSGVAQPTGKEFTDKYALDCVSWISFVVKNSLGVDSDKKSNIYYGVPRQPGGGGSVSNGFKIEHGNIHGPKIPLSEIVSNAKPGDFLFGCAQHILLYVGNGEIIHCVTSGLKRQKISDYSAGYCAIGRITLLKAMKVEKNNATTIFAGTGGISGKIDWTSSSWTGKLVYSDELDKVKSKENERIVDVNDKIEIYKHILFTEKYNFNRIDWKKFGHYAGKKGEVGTNEKGFDVKMLGDVSLGLKYPEDDEVMPEQTNLSKFIDMTLPFLQTWYIPIAFTAGSLDRSINDETKPRNPEFIYSIIKEAYSNILVHRFDVEEYFLETKYAKFDRFTKHSEITGVKVSKVDIEYMDFNYNVKYYMLGEKSYMYTEGETKENKENKENKKNFEKYFNFMDEIKDNEKYEIRYDKEVDKYGVMTTIKDNEDKDTFSYCEIPRDSTITRSNQLYPKNNKFTTINGKYMIDVIDDSKLLQVTTNTERINNRLDQGGVDNLDPSKESKINRMKEEKVYDRTTYTPSYYIREAKTFDVYYANTFNYIMYDDLDKNVRVVNLTKGYKGSEVYPKKEDYYYFDPKYDGIRIQKLIYDNT